MLQHCYYYKSKRRILLELGVMFDLLDTTVGICLTTAGAEVCRVRKKLGHWLSFIVIAKSDTLIEKFMAFITKVEGVYTSPFSGYIQEYRHMRSNLRKGVACACVAVTTIEDVIQQRLS